MVGFYSVIEIASYYGKGKEQKERGDEPEGEISIAKYKEEEVERVLEA